LAKVAVVGGGAAGLLAARYLALSGCDVVVLEEHERVGWPRRCTGVVSPATASRIGRPAEVSKVASLRKIVLKHALGGSLTLEGSPLAVVLDRVKLEEELAREAESAGARLELGVRVEGVEADGRVRAGGASREFDFVVVATGASSPLSEVLWRDKPRSARGINFLVEGARGGLKAGEGLVVLGPAGGELFSWRLALGGGAELLGSVGKNLSTRREELLRRVAEVSGSRPARVLEIFGGRVLFGPPLPRLRFGKLLVFGDAARLSKPLSGGGLYAAAYAAPSAPARCCERALELLASRAEAVATALRRQLPLAEVAHDPRNASMLSRALAALSRATGGSVAVSDFDDHEGFAKAALKGGRAALAILEALPSLPSLVRSASKLLRFLLS